MADLIEINEQQVISNPVANSKQPCETKGNEETSVTELASHFKETKVQDQAEKSHQSDQRPCVSNAEDHLPCSNHQAMSRAKVISNENIPRQGRKQLSSDMEKHVQRLRAGQLNKQKAHEQTKEKLFPAKMESNTRSPLSNSLNITSVRKDLRETQSQTVNNTAKKTERQSTISKRVQTVPLKPISSRKPATTGGLSRKPEAQPAKKKPSPVFVPNDIVSKLAAKNLQQIINDIFMPLSPSDLRNCRQVCKEWRSVIRSLWLNRGTFNQLETRLKQRFLRGIYKRVELKLEGHACTQMCQLNGRDCNCIPATTVQDNHLVVQWGSNRLSVETNINDKHKSRDELTFDRNQFQIRFSVMEELKLDSRNGLKSLVFMGKTKQQKKFNYREFIVEANGELSSLLVSRVKLSTSDRNGSVKSDKPNSWNVSLFTGFGRKRRIDSIQVNGTRMAALMEGKVFLYDLDKLLDQNSQPPDALLLLATRADQSEVVAFHLTPSYLITMSRCHYLLFDYWSDDNTMRSEFFV